MVDEMFRTDELNQYLSRMNLTPRWEDGIFDLSLIHISEPTRH